MFSRFLLSTSGAAARLTRAAAFSALAATALPAVAQQLEVEVEIPRLKVAEYHRPYVAIWAQHTETGDVTNLAVWYDTELRDREGEKWLKDMRLWWRRSGRSLELPVDGVTGATKAPGKHQLSFDANLELDDGDYQLFVEAAREVGGRETVSIPFQWPPQKAQQRRESGSSELGQVQLRLQPKS